jgi:hypothetical protein
MHGPGAGSRQKGDSSSRYGAVTSGRMGDEHPPTLTPPQLSADHVIRWPQPMDPGYASLLWRHQMMNPARSRRASYLIVAVAVVLSLTGCIKINKTDNAKTGSSPAVTSATKEVPTAKVLYDAMRKNVTAAKSVRIKGEITSAGKKMKIDIAGDRDGTNTRAMLNDGTVGAELLTVGATTYIKADAAYWAKNGSPAVAKIAAGKYIKLPAGAGTNDLKVATLLDGVFTKDLPLSGMLQKVETADVAGVPAYVLTDKVGGENGKLYISADGQSNLLRIVSLKAKSGTLDFTEWNAVAPMSAPPASEVVKIPGQP